MPRWLACPRRRTVFGPCKQNQCCANQRAPNTISALREVFWAWPLVYMSNLKQSMNLVRSPGRSAVRRSPPSIVCAC